MLEGMAEVDPTLYDLRRLHRAVEHDVEVLTEIWLRVRGVGPGEDSGTKAKDRLRLVQAFAPKANARPEWSGTEKEVDILISTDVLSEGQNLQDCGFLVNYDLHFWRYVDFTEEEILDNRHVIASLIACRPDTPRVVDPLLWSRIFEHQERLIDDILRSVEQQVSLEEAPRVVDPLQQTVATTLQAAASRPGVDRRRVLSAVRFLVQPMVGAEVKDLRSAYRVWQRGRDPEALLGAVEAMRQQRGEAPEAAAAVVAEPGGEASSSSQGTLRRDQLRLICFDLVTEGRSAGKARAHACSV